MKETSRFYREVLARYADTYLAPDLKAAGFSMYRNDARRWHRVINNVIQSVQFVPNCGAAELYFGFQPLFYPFAFTDRPMVLHDNVWSFFDAEAEFHRLVPKEARKYAALPDYHCSSFSLYDGRPLERCPAEFRKKTEYYQQVLRRLILPTLFRAQDVASSHAVYKDLFWGRYVSDPEALYDARYLLECVALRKTEELNVFAEKALLPILHNTDSHESELPLDLLSGQGVAPKALYQILRSEDYAYLEAFMKQNEAAALAKIRRAGIPMLERQPCDETESEPTAGSDHSITEITLIRGWHQ